MVPLLSAVVPDCESGAVSDSSRGQCLISGEQELLQLPAAAAVDSSAPVRADTPRAQPVARQQLSSSFVGASRQLSDAFKARRRVLPPANTFVHTTSSLAHTFNAPSLRRMKITVNSYHAIAMWRWNLQSGQQQQPGVNPPPQRNAGDAGDEEEEEEEEDDDDDDVCGICRVAYDGCCPDCKTPGDECPLSTLCCTPPCCPRPTEDAHGIRGAVISGLSFSVVHRARVPELPR